MLGGASGEKTEKQMERNGDDRLESSHRQITDTGSQYRVQPTRVSVSNEETESRTRAREDSIEQSEAKRCYLGLLQVRYPRTMNFSSATQQAKQARIL